MGRAALVTALLLPLLVISSSLLIASEPATTRSATTPSESATDAAKRFAQVFTQGEPTDAIEQFLDRDALLRGMFEEDFDHSSAAEQQEMRGLLTRIFNAIYSDSQVRDFLKGARAENFKELRPHNPNAPADLVIVTFDLITGEKRSTQRLFFKPIDGRWRLIDLSGGGPTMADGCRGEYRPQRDKTTPVKFLREMATAVQRKRG